MKWYLDLEEYIRLGEPDQVTKCDAWKTAIGLQQVDRLHTSEYLLEIAKEHIEGKITITDVQNKISSYYDARVARSSVEISSKEADIVASRITQELEDQSFKFSPVEWMAIHKRMFNEVFDFAGTIRDYNISKKEWILNGNSVVYSSFYNIEETLAYDFQQEQNFSYVNLSEDEIIRHIAKFTSDIWQIHPFCEGNTRATAVFIIKYMRTLGMELNNDAFASNSWFFRNALVRANYNDFKNGIHATTDFLEMFFRNFLLGKDNELKNRYLHVGYGGTLSVKETADLFELYLEGLA